MLILYCVTPSGHFFHLQLEYVWVFFKQVVPPDFTDPNREFLGITRGEGSSLGNSIQEGDTQKATQLSLSVLSLMDEFNKTINKTQVRRGNDVCKTSVYISLKHYR